MFNPPSLDLANGIAAWVPRRQAALVRGAPLSAMVPDTKGVGILRQAQVERLQRLVEGLQQGERHY